MTNDTAHYDALSNRLANERGRLASAKTEQEREMRRVWVEQIEKEMKEEANRVLGINPDDDISDDELLKALLA